METHKTWQMRRDEQARQETADMLWNKYGVDSFPAIAEIPIELTEEKKKKIIEQVKRQVKEARK